MDERLNRELEGQDSRGAPPSAKAPALDAQMLALLTQSFSAHAGPDQRIDAADLQHALRVRGQFLAERMMTILDRNGDGCVDRAEFLEAVRRLVFGSAREKLRLAFEIHDLDGN